jgi:hypothetical protein
MMTPQEQYEAEAQRRAQIISDACVDLSDEWRKPVEIFLGLFMRLVEATEGPQVMRSLINQPLSPDDSGVDPADDGPWMRETKKHARAWP